MKQSGTAQRSRSGRWPAWLVVQSGGAVAPWRNAPFALFVVCVMGYGAVYAWYMLDRFDLVNLLRDASYDDAFYYFQIAYHMAEGRFSTFDGGLTRTNGYHPLWLFAITPFYWVFDKAEALFAVKAFEIMLVAGGVALVAVAARVARLPWFLLFAALPTLYVQRGMLFGLEAALGLFTLGLLLLLVCLFGRDPARWRRPLAAAVFALPWVRLEYAAIAVAVSAALCLIEWTGRLSGAPETAADGPSSRLPGRATLRPWGLNAALPLAGAVAGMLVYFAYNGIVFGGIVPVSGAVKALWAQNRLREERDHDLAANFNAFAQSRYFDDELLIALEVCVYALLVWWLSRRFRSREGALLLVFMVGVFGLAAGHLAKFAQNVFFMHPTLGGAAWYYVPAYLMEALVVPVRCFVGIYVLRCVFAAEGSRAADILCLGIVAAGVALLARADFAAPFRFVDTRSESTSVGLNLHSYMGVLAMNRLLPEGALAGSWDSGVVGYFARFPVMNLDGLANSYGYRKLMEDGHVNPFDRRLGGSGLSYFVNVFRKTDVSGFSGAGRCRWFETAATSRADAYLGGAHDLGGTHFRVYLRSPCERSVPLRAEWEERLSLERQADGTGLLAEGRMAQAFAAECAADEVAEWTFGGRVGAVSHWTRTRSGLCASAVVLPRGHLPPVRVRRAALREALARLAAGRPPAIRADTAHSRGFDVHLLGRRLVYAKEKCERVDVETPFFLHLGTIGDDFHESRAARHENADFMLEVHGGWSGEDGRPCLAEVALPRTGIAAVRTGQYGRAWEGTIPLDLERSADGVGVFAMGRTAWAFASECAADEVAAWSFWRRTRGADALDQCRLCGNRSRRRALRRQEGRAIDTWTRTANGSCASTVALPFGHLPPLRARRVSMREALAWRFGGQAPAISADPTHSDGFDVYLAEGTLVYAKERCEQSDVETPFFLHLVPAGDDFDDGRASSFNNADFMFRHRGVWSGDGGTPCLTEVPLPEYGIAEIRTGQYRADDWHRVWEGEVRLDQPATEGA